MMLPEKSRKVHYPENTGFARCYLIETFHGLLVVDVGSVGCARDVEEYVTTVLGRSLDDIIGITATHFHIDHIGGISHLAKKCKPETKILFNYRIADYLSGKRKISLIRNWFAGMMPATAASSRYVKRISHIYFDTIAGIPLPGIRSFSKISLNQKQITYFGSYGLRRYKMGYEEWEIIETPGHTEDSICFFNELSGELICGDLIVNISRHGKGRLNNFCWCKKQIEDSYRFLVHAIHPTVIYPGHGDPITNTGNALLDVKSF